MFMRPGFVRPRRKRRVRVAALSGLGVFEYDKSVLAAVQEQTNWSWGGIAYGDVGSDASRREIHDLIVARASALRDSGALDDTDAGRMIMAADGGSFVYPALTSAMSADAIAKTAWYKMMADSGLWDLRKQVLWLTKQQALKEAKETAANAALWDAITTPLEYVSGAKAVEKLAEILANIRSEVKATNDILGEAKRTLSAERYAKVAEAAGAVSAQLVYLEKHVPGATEDTGKVGLAWVQAAVVIAIGVAIGIASVCWAYVANKKTQVANKLADMAEEQRKAEVAAAMANPNLTPDQKQEAVVAAGQRAQATGLKAGELAKAAGAGGLFGIDFKWLAIAGAVAALGIFVLPQVIRMFPKGKTAQA
jgi:hypothetical protein